MIQRTEQEAWVYRSPGYRAINLTFAVRSTEADVGGYLDRALSGLHCDEAAPEVWYSIARSAAGSDDTYSLFFGSELIVDSHTKAFAIETLLWHLNGATVRHADPYVVLHAGGVALDGAGVIISGSSGAGKTTLTAALVRAGSRYLTDEALAVDPLTGLLHPYAKALALKRGSWGLLAGLRPAPTELSPRVWHVAPTDLGRDTIAGPTRPALVLLLEPSRAGKADHTPSFQEVGRSEALVELFRESFGNPDPPATLRTLAGLVASCACLRVSTRDLADTVAQVADAVSRSAR